MDCVYVLGTGSSWDNNELRYSLRSIETYLSGFDKVFVVGHRPQFLTNVIHLPFNDRFSCKERNIMLKLARACGHPDLSTEFLHIHDDHFCLNYQDAETIPYWHSGTLEKTAKAVKPTNHWRDAVLNTHKVLTSLGLTANNFDIHFPMIFNKDAYPEIMDRYNWGEPRGFVVKSLYANTMKIEGTYTGDLKINQRFKIPDLVTRLRGRQWFSLGNGGLSGEFKNLIMALYPEKSKFEV